MAEERENGLVSKWGNELFDDGIFNAPQCFARYGRRFVTPGEFSFIVCVLTYQYGSDLPFPSQQTIANNMGIHIRQIGKWIDSMEEKGLIEIFYRYDSDGNRTSNEYSFEPLIKKCLAESNKEKGEREKSITRKKKERKKKSATCTTGTDSDTNFTTCTSSTDSEGPQVQIETGPQVQIGHVPQVQTKKESEERNLEESKNNNVCVEEQRILDLINSREDLKTHTRKIISILNKKKKNKSFNYDVFQKTLEIIDLDIKGISYLETALMNNLKKGFVVEFKESDNLRMKDKVVPIRKELLPDWFDKQEEQDAQARAELAEKRKEDPFYGYSLKDLRKQRDVLLRLLKLGHTDETQKKLERVEKKISEVEDMFGFSKES